MYVSESECVCVSDSERVCKRPFACMCVRKSVYV